MTDEELLEIIARAEREGWTELDLSGNDLIDRTTKMLVKHRNAKVKTL